jgi:hypothetical protein
MPWCDACDRFYTPTTLTAEGDCPEGHHVADPGDESRLVQSTAPPREEEPAPKVPWHFWVLLVSVVAYLGWRLIQGVEWLFG